MSWLSRVTSRSRDSVHTTYYRFSEVRWLGMSRTDESWVSPNSHVSYKQRVSFSLQLRRILLTVSLTRLAMFSDLSVRVSLRVHSTGVWRSAGFTHRIHGLRLVHLKDSSS